MELTGLSFEERLKMMRKRHAYFSAMAEKCSTFDEFVKENDELLAIVGIELTRHDNHLYLYIPLGFSDYEGYHIIRASTDKLCVSPIISWQDDYCANAYLNVFTGKSADEPEIFLTCIAK